MKRSVNFFNIVSILAILVGTTFIRQVSAAPLNGYFYTVRRYRTTSLPSNAGLAYDPASGMLLALSQANATQNLRVQSYDRILEEASVESLALVSGADSMHTTFDSTRGVLLAYGPNSGRLTTLEKDSSRPSANWQAAGDQSLHSSEQRDALRGAGEGTQVSGITANPQTGMLFLLNADNQTITGFMPGESAPVQQIRLAEVQETQPRGLAWNPNNGHFYTAVDNGSRVLEIAPDGSTAAVLDLAAAGLKVTGGLVFAPSGDETDDPAEYSLYAVAEYQASGENQIVELTLTAPPKMMDEDLQMNGLVRTIHAYAWRPSSPDTSGLSYWPAKGSYLVSDGEVEDYPDFTGDNLYQMSSSGTLQSSYSAMAYSSEPTGVAVNKINGEIYISDDARRRVYVVRVGSDGKLNTDDDQVTYFSTYTGVLKSPDPEGLGWGEGLLFIVDGTNSQVYVLAPGPNGRFDGVPTTGDDVLVRQFDTEARGIADPEGIDYNPQTGTLFIAGNNSRNRLLEYTVEGSFVRSWDISAIPSENPAGIGIGPSSYDPDVYSIFMADRGTDVVGSSTHDGMIFEINISGSLPPTATHTATPTRTSTPTPTNTPTQTPTKTVDPALLMLPIYMPVIFH